MRDLLYGAIEGGGTKFVCALGRSPDGILERATFPTTGPEATLAACLRFLQEAARAHGPLAAVGIACFGPLQLRTDAADHGHMLSTPKAGWSGADLIGLLRDSLRIPVVIDTDVGAAARAEWEIGARKKLGSLAYVTVGTGIGGAVAPIQDPERRLMHAEMGHLPVRRHPRDEAFAGVCPFHGDCLEGLASGPAIRARWGCDLSDLPATHEGRKIIAGYLGQLATSIALLHGVERIVFGGGVMSDGSLLPLIRASMHTWLNGYIHPLRAVEKMQRYLSAPLLGPDAAIAGAMLLAMDSIIARGTDNA
jgi:fructokinase